MNFCSKCGNEIKKGAKFCSECGENLTIPKNNSSQNNHIQTDGNSLNRNEGKQNNRNVNVKQNKKPSIILDKQEGQDIIKCKNCGSNTIEVAKINSGMTFALLSFAIPSFFLIAVFPWFLFIWLGIIFLAIIFIFLNRGKYKVTCKKCGFVTNNIDKQIVQRYINKVNSK